MDAHDKTEERAAWDDYLYATRGKRDSKYARAESYAWARLQARLGRLKPRRVRSAA